MTGKLNVWEIEVLKGASFKTGYIWKVIDIEKLKTLAGVTQKTETGSSQLENRWPYERNTEDK